MDTEGSGRRIGTICIQGRDHGLWVGEAFVEMIIFLNMSYLVADSLVTTPRELSHLW